MHFIQVILVSQAYVSQENTLSLNQGENAVVFGSSALIQDIYKTIRMQVNAYRHVYPGVTISPS